MIKIEFSEHAAQGREERMVQIATTIGFGEVFATFPRRNQHGVTIHCITDTGVLIIKNVTQTKVITMFPLNEAKLRKYYQDQKIPYWLLKVVRNNYQKRKFLFEI